ncbi:helix-turn-helix domain-containing protein [Pseudidiomarina homiensis]|uniref:HTH cro/C1-type domain-containing protein n=1 Tax=Pseudidiomarina homiensis TaxID=364198 RepID=A0A432Y3N6_9GAMM|nr:helix-turn-helix transcriptional regulator [Pseudidiomarina homiensis]RUO55521.1 hypothetical protein CWI70_01680 [Pseudidiomarina homiensis]
MKISKLAQNFAINLGYVIQHKRSSCGLDQRMLAQRVGSSRATISRLERGRSVALETVLLVLAELDMLKDIAYEVAAHADGVRFYQRKKSGPRDPKKQKKWEEFQKYWLGDNYGN